MVHQHRDVALRHHSTKRVSVAIDASLREVGLNLAVATMRKGERCHLRVRPEYGFGDRGDCVPFQLCFASEHCSDVFPERLTFLSGAYVASMSVCHAVVSWTLQLYDVFLLKLEVSHRDSVCALKFVQAASPSQLCHLVLSWSMNWSSSTLTLLTRWHAMLSVSPSHGINTFTIEISAATTCSSHGFSSLA